MSTVTLRDLNGQESRIKKSAAKLLVCALEAKKITRELYQRVALTPEQERERRLEVIRTLYIPETMPPREVPGVFFQPPQSATWREHHRVVSFMVADGATA